ncbi:hypothetical protein ACTXT7_011511 [Hymenolepis weldensis]
MRTQLPGPPVDAVIEILSFRYPDFRLFGKHFGKKEIVNRGKIGAFPMPQVKFLNFFKRNLFPKRKNFANPLEKCLQHDVSRSRYSQLIGLLRYINNFVSTKKQLGGARHVAFNTSVTWGFFPDFSLPINNSNELSYPVVCAAYRHDGREIAVALLNATILFFDAAEGTQLGSIEGRCDLDVAQVSNDDLVTPHRAAKERGRMHKGFGKPP